MDNQKHFSVKGHDKSAKVPEESPTEGAEQPRDEGAPSPKPPEPVDWAAAYEKLRGEKDQLYDRLLRKQAELENLRKRTQREKEEFRQHATEDLIRALLPALDAFERALKHRDASVPEPVYQGLEMIYRQFHEVLGRAGLVPLDTAGKVFDPHLHQAVESVETAEHGDQEIIEELQRGYKLRHRLLRPAIVKVAVRPARRDSQEQPGETEPTE